MPNWFSQIKNTILGDQDSSDVAAPSVRNLAFEEAQYLAENASHDKRLELASSQSSSPELLYFFASRGELDERASVAANPVAPIQADVWLSNDESESIRSILAFKATKLANNEQVCANEERRNNVLCILDNLSKEHFPNAQNPSSDNQMGIDEATKSVMDMVLSDTPLKVMGSVLEFSPLIGDREILYLLNNGLGSNGLCAIAKRSDLSESVIEALMRTENPIVRETILANVNYRDS